MEAFPSRQGITLNDLGYFLKQVEGGGYSVDIDYGCESRENGNPSRFLRVSEPGLYAFIHATRSSNVISAGQFRLYVFEDEISEFSKKIVGIITNKLNRGDPIFPEKGCRYDGSIYPNIRMRKAFLYIWDEN